jgi:hypothetical protein
MSRITVAFDERSSHAWSTPVPVEIFDERLARVADEVVYLGHRASIDVGEPGLYHVRAELPSGENVSTTVRVAEGEQDALATLVAGEASPRKTLAWAYARQSVRRASGRPSEERPGKRSREVLDVFRGVATVFPPAVYLDGLFRIQPRQDAWLFVHYDWPLHRDDSVADDDARLITQVKIPSADNGEDTFPLYARITVLAGPPTIRIIALPTTHSPALLFVHEEGGDTLAESTVRALVTGARPEAEALMAYLEHGSIGAARRIGPVVTEGAVELLKQKRMDPFGACIAGYFLLRAGKLERQQWMKNLADWFAEIPDGAVIYAVSLLRGEDGEERQEEAREYLLKAAERGIPVYTAGLRLLFDCLQFLARERQDDGEVESALARIRFIAAYTDWDAQTTTFFIPHSADWRPFSFVGKEGG